MNIRETYYLGWHYLSKLKRGIENGRKIISTRASNLGAQIGPNVQILGSPRQLSIGRGTRIEDGAILDFRFDGALFLGEGVTVQTGAILAPFGGYIRIGNHCGVNHYTVLYGHGGLTVGEFVRFAPHCLVIPANHSTIRRDIPIYNQPLTKKGIVIGDDVWIGAHSAILDGVSIGSGSVIAAGSIVTESVEAWTIAAGVPARAVRTR